MNIDDLKRKVNVRHDGAIFLGTNVVCDGSDFGVRNAVFTQTHSDRISAFPTALQTCENVLVSEPTASLLISDKFTFGNFLTIKKNFKPLKYEQSFSDGNSEITLYKSNHILGASQVLVKEDDVRILYPGEFQLSSDIPISSDILVLDSTHGTPNFKKDNNVSATQKKLVELIREKIESGTSIILQAQRGQLQELMSYLSNELPEPVPFLAPENSCYFADVYRSFGYEIKDLYTNNTERCEEIISSETPVVQYVSNNKRDILKISEELEGTNIFKINIGADIKQAGGIYHFDVINRSARFNLPINASFEEIIEYVRKSNPQVVITNNVRTSFGQTLATEIHDRLGIDAYSYPTK